MAAALNAPVAFAHADTAALRGRSGGQSLASRPFDLVELDRAHARLAIPLLRRHDATLVAPELALWRIRSHALRSLLPVLRALHALRFAEPDRPLRSAAAPPLRRILQSDPLAPNEYWIQAVGADRVVPPGPGKPVTVIDTGLDTTHPEFAGRPDTTLLGPQRVVGRDDDHGTAVSSVVGAPANGVGLVGVYPQAALQEWDASPNGSANLTYAAEIKGILTAARRGPSVINLSLGSADYDRIEEEAILTAFRLGSLVVASAGNEFQDGNPEEYPASLNHVLTVAATDESNRPTYFSSSSLSIDLAAPGQDIPVAVPLAYNSAGYDVYDGTSFSAPLVSGAAAWVWTARPTLDNTQLFDLMRFSARDVWDRGYDEDTGFGLLDIPAALARTPPPPDPLEPNDDVDQVKPRGLFTRGADLLTRASRPRAVLRGRVDGAEDPDDLYRVAVPPHTRVTVFVTGSGDVELDLWGPTTRTVFEEGAAALKRDLLAFSERPGKRQELVRYTNRSARGFVAYADVFLARNAVSSSYALSVTTSPARGSR